MNLHEYMFNKNNLLKYKSTSLKTQENNRINLSYKNNIKTPKKSYSRDKVLITHQDKLFWCFYTFLTKDNNLDIPNIFKIEKDFKIETIILMRKKSAILKLHSALLLSQILRRRHLGIVSPRSLLYLNS